MGEILKAMERYGVGFVATAIIFALFIYYIRETLKMQKEHNETQTSALVKVSDSNNNVAEALKLIRDMFIDRTNTIENKQDITLGVLRTHCSDVNRIEGNLSTIHTAVLKTEERTKICLDREHRQLKGE